MRALLIAAVLCLAGCPDPTPEPPVDDDDVADDDDDDTDDDDSAGDDDDDSAIGDDDDSATGDDDDSAPQPCLVDVDFFEPNDSPEEALLGYQLFSLWMFDHGVCPGRDDYYWRAIASHQWHLTQISYDPSDGHLSLSVYDGDGQLVDQSASGSGFEETSIGPPPNSAGTYMVRIEVVEDFGEPGVLYDIGHGRCGADDFDPNESFGEAAYAPGSLHLLGQTLCPGDGSDWYHLPELQNDAMVDLRMLWDSCEGEIDAWLYDAEGAIVASGENAGIAFESMQYIVQEPGDYYLELSLGADGGVQGVPWYDMSLPISPRPATCDPDRFEPNDSAVDAPWLTTTIYNFPFTACGEGDHYRFDAEAGDAVELLLDFAHAEGNLDLVVTDDGGSVIASGTSSDDDELLTFVAPDSGTLHVEVELAEDTGVMPGNRYFLSLSGITPYCPPDVYEPNDTVEQAVPDIIGIALDQTMCPGDVDWFRIDLGFLWNVRINAGFVPFEGNIDAFLYDDTGTNLVASGTHDFFEDFEYLSPTGGTYYLKLELVEERGVIPGNIYDFDIVALPSTACSAEWFEPNDDLGSATWISPGDDLGVVWVCIDEPDFFAFDAQEGDEIDVSVLFDSAEGDIDLALYDPAGQEVTADAGGGDDAQITWTVPPGGGGTWTAEVWLETDDGPSVGASFELDLVVSP